MKGQPLFDVYYSDDEQQAYPTFDHYKYTEEPVSKQNHPMVPIYDEYESDLGESQQEEEKEPEGQSALCSEPVSEQPPPEISEPTSVIHPPVVIRDIRPHVNNCVAEEAVCRQFSLEMATHSMTLSANTWSGISPMPWSRPISSQLQPVRRS
jgi:hypothetical protein